MISEIFRIVGDYAIMPHILTTCSSVRVCLTEAFTRALSLPFSAAYMWIGLFSAENLAETISLLAFLCKRGAAFLQGRRHDPRVGSR